MSSPATVPITPEERWGELGLYEARGMTGGEALARSLDYPASWRVPPVTTSLA
ncbi:hypothetical protein [Streptomyces inhibens]|uniref:hypothetical protein n=1 Tax=Streptomyces inhibens TaxID=2293571 RepID=UPI0015F2763D|nr:hypothetical protein [Streptomyces inhibens]